MKLILLGSVNKEVIGKDAREKKPTENETVKAVGLERWVLRPQRKNLSDSREGAEHSSFHQRPRH